MGERGDTETLWTVPNLLCGVRLVGIIPLLWVAYQGHRSAFLWILLVLLVSDWLDGKLAIMLDQRTTFGARLDSVADAVMYFAVGLSFWWLEEQAMREDLEWFLATAATWSLSALVGLFRFGRLPSYHTWGAKASWLMVGITAVIWILTGDTTLVPWALGLVILTNLEAAAVGVALPSWRANVATLYHAVRLHRRENDDDSKG